MTSLTGRFQRDITFLSQNLIPLTSTGQEILTLDYMAEQFESLTDTDVQLLSNSLTSNTVFKGPLDLSENSLTDLSALFLAELLKKEKGYNITDLNLSKTKMQSKAGIFIGEALVANPSYPIERIQFRDINLEENGLHRLMEAAKNNKNIQKLHVGIISDVGLNIMSELLVNNTSLIRLEFQENEAKPWSEAAKLNFCSILKNNTELEMIKFTSFLGEEAHQIFKQEIDFYTNKKLTQHKQQNKFEKRQQDCNPDDMFENMIQLIEDKEQQRRMPVRKFFNNTFGTFLNDAIFALKKKQSKEPDNQEICTKKGSVKFVAMYLLENLPQHEREPDLYDSSDSHEDQ